MPESSTIIEYLAQHYPGGTQLVPADADLARQTRLRDRFFDLYVNVPMQKVVTDRLRPEGQRDAYGVEEAMALLRTACGMVDGDMHAKPWVTGEPFTMADCAAGPALYYANLVMPLADAHPRAAAYLARAGGTPVLRACNRGSGAVSRALPAIRRHDDAIHDADDPQGVRDGRSRARCPTPRRSRR